MTVRCAPAGGGARPQTCGLCAAGVEKRPAWVGFTLRKRPKPGGVGQHERPVQGRVLEHRNTFGTEFSYDCSNVPNFFQKSWRKIKTGKNRHSLFAQYVRYDFVRKFRNIGTNLTDQALRCSKSVPMFRNLPEKGLPPSFDRGSHRGGRGRFITVAAVERILSGVTLSNSL